LEFIDTFEMRYPGMSHAEVAALNPSPTRNVVPPSGGTVDAPTVTAFVDGSRWVARCPFCAGAERVNFQTALFFCCGCRNQVVDRAFLRVTLPAKGNREKIERALLKRPDWLKRAWFPHESVADLERQNKDHGVVG